MSSPKAWDVASMSLHLPCMNWTMKLTCILAASVAAVTKPQQKYLEKGDYIKFSFKGTVHCVGGLTIERAWGACSQGIHRQEAVGDECWCLAHLLCTCLATRARKTVAHIVGEFFHLSSSDLSTPSTMHPDIYLL